MFVDKVRITVIGGRGGDGAVAFHREKYVASGGPDGGDGGHGGNIVFRVDEGTNTLLAFRYKHKFIAQNGGNGKGSKFHGATADDLIIMVPPGTLIRDAETGIKDYKVYIDGQFALFKFSSKNARLSSMHPSRIKRGTKHTMEVVITDYCGNVTKEEYQF